MESKKCLFIMSIMGIFILVGIILKVSWDYSYNKSTNYNVIILIIDCLRADHLGCYGYHRNTSPNIDKLAKSGVLFSEAISQGSGTPLSIPSILTSEYTFGANTLGEDYKLKDSVVTLPEILKRNGYVTGAFVGGGFLNRRFGFNQGFDVYEDSKGGEMDNILPLVYEWLKQNRNKKFFLFLHTYDVHEPFEPPEPFNKIFYSDYNGKLENKFLNHQLLYKIWKGELSIDQRDKNYILSQYDGAIRYVDSMIGKLMDKLKTFGLTNNTLFIFTSDHGEAFFEHNSVGHGDVYDEVIRVPLIFHLPSILPKSRRIDTQVRSIDIMPTVLDILGIKKTDNMEGVSLKSLIRGRKRKDFLEAYTIGARRGIYNEEVVRISVRENGWKLIHSLGKNIYELYNLKVDPKELNNLVLEEREKFIYLKEKLIDFERVGAQKLKQELREIKVLDEGVRQELKSLGYIE